MNAQRDAIDKFFAAVRHAAAQLDGCVPVAMIFLPSRPNRDGALDVEYEGQAWVIWRLPQPRSRP